MAGDRVGASEATLLNMLKISPFSYGLVIQQGTFNLFFIKVNKVKKIRT